MESVEIWSERVRFSFASTLADIKSDVSILEGPILFSSNKNKLCFKAV